MCECQCGEAIGSALGDRGRFPRESGLGGAFWVEARNVWRPRTNCTACVWNPAVMHFSGSSRSHGRADEEKAVDVRWSHWIAGFEGEGGWVLGWSQRWAAHSYGGTERKARDWCLCPQSAEQRSLEERERSSAWRLIWEPFKECRQEIVSGQTGPKHRIWKLHTLNSRLIKEVASSLYIYTHTHTHTHTHTYRFLLLGRWCTSNCSYSSC